MNPVSRRSFLANAALGTVGAVAAEGLLSTAAAQQVDKSVLGDAGVQSSKRPEGAWKPVSDRKIRVGIAGYGVCKFGAQFGFQDHPNVTVAAVTDLIPERCAGLAKECRCDKTYASLEEMVKDDTLEAIYVATDAPSHARHCIEVLKQGKHVASAVPAVFGSLEEADRLLEAVRTSGRTYMMFETSAYHEDLYAMRQIYQAGGFGKLIYSEGEYFHFMPQPIDSYHTWRVGLPPQWYPTHSNAYYICTTGGSFTDVACMAMPSVLAHLQPENNPYKNAFGTEIAMFRTSEGGMSRMAVSWDTRCQESESGRVKGERGSMTGMDYFGVLKKLPNLSRPPLPPSVATGGHGGSHGPLMHEFITAILEERKPLVDIIMALNMTVPGIVAHQSAVKNGELLKIPQYGQIAGPHSPFTRT